MTENDTNDTQTMSDDSDDAQTEQHPDSPEYNQGRQDAVSSGVKIRAKVKRGEGTRDQDELLIEGRGASADEAAQDFETALRAAEDEGWADRLRAIQPEDDDE